MARMRSLKPEFWDDRKLARSTSRDARMLYMALWNHADEHSRVNGDVVWIKGRAFPYDDDLEPSDIKNLLDELVAADRITPYEVDGDPYFFLRKLGAHQRLDSGVASRLPEPPTRTGVDAYAPGYAPETNESVPRTNESVPETDESEPDTKTSALKHVAGSRLHVAVKKSQERARGARLPDEWTPDPDLIEAMRTEGIPDDIARRELVRFRDYWAGVPGAKGCKADWPATWRNWLRRTLDQTTDRAPPANGKASTKAQGWLDVDEPTPPRNTPAVEGRTR